LDWFEVEGPLVEQWPLKSHRVLFGDLPIKPFVTQSGLRQPPRSVVKQIAVNARPTNGELTKEDRNETLETVTSEQPLEDARLLLSRFLPKAFRRHVSPNEVLEYFGIAKARLDARDTFEDAMREAYKAALCSTDFLFEVKRSGSVAGGEGANERPRFG